MQVYIGRVETKFGAVHYAVTEQVAVAITVPGQAQLEIFGILGRRGFKATDWLPDTGGLHNVRQELEEYFSGTRREFTFPLDMQGTAFELRVWQALRDIPYGERRSYSDIARAVGVPKGARAVGGANSRNPLPLVVPCHRVCAQDGGLGGFAGGLECKRFLLDLEQRGPVGERSH